jgi:hypothetical protein
MLGERKHIGFDTDAPRTVPTLHHRGTSGLAQFLITKNIAADRQSAEVLLVALAVLFFGITIVLLIFGLRNEPIPENVAPVDQLLSYVWQHHT